MSFRNLPYHDLPVGEGINSAYEPESETFSSVNDLQNMDWSQEFRTLAKVPGSSDVASADVGNPIDSIHYFEFLDLDGVRKRHYLCLSNGNLYTIQPGVGFTSVLSGTLGSDPLREAKLQERIHFSSPAMVGQATGGVKYDGTRVTNWGVKAPGQEETVKYPFDVTTGWADSPDCDSSIDTDVSWDGTASFVLDKVGATVTSCASTCTLPVAIDMTTATDGFAYVYLFLPSGVIQQLATSGTAVQLILGTGIINVDYHNYSVGELLPGWNLLSLDLLNPDAVGGVGATLANITILSVGLQAKTIAQTWTDVRFDKLFHLSDGDCSAAVGAAGQISAAVTYRFTFVTEYGVESNLGPASSSVSPSSQQVDLTSCPISTDPQVIARRIYRDKDGDAIFRFVDQLDDNVTTTYTDNVADASLGGATAPIAGDSLLDSSPPPKFAAVVTHGERIWGVDARVRSTLWPSDVNSPEQFRLVDQVSLEDDVVAMFSTRYGLLVFSTDQTHLITGDGITSPFRSDLVGPQLGVNGVRSLCAAKSLQIVVREAEMFQVVDPADPWMFNGPILDKFRALTPATLQNSFIIHDRKWFRILFFDGTETILVWQYATSGKPTIGNDGAIDPLDLRMGRWLTLFLPPSVDPNDAVVVERTADEPEVWLAGNDGRVYQLTDTSQTNWANDGATAAIDSFIEFHAVPLGARQRSDGGWSMSPVGRGEPRYLELQTNSTTGGDVTVVITMLDGADGNALDAITWDITIPSGSDSQIVGSGSARRASTSSRAARSVASRHDPD
jgi:hypothetical protein